MANRTPLTAFVVERLVDVQVLARQVVTADGVVCATEQRLLDGLRETTLSAEDADQARVEAIYALNVGLEDAPSAWHARKRREAHQRKRDDAGRRKQPTS